MSSVKKKVRLVTDREKLEILVSKIAEQEYLNSFIDIEKLNLVKKRILTDELMQVISEAVKHCMENDLKIDMADLGTFEPRIRGKRNGVNPQLYTKCVNQGMTKEEASEKSKIVLPKQKTVGFKPSEEMKDLIRDKF